MRFVQRFESCELPPPFSHRDHLRLAYIHLTQYDVGAACATIKPSLLRYIAHHGADPRKYHETMTRSWLMAVRHFMAISPPSDSAEASCTGSSRIMLRHYSSERLFSESARLRFLDPDLLPIPEYST